MASLFTTPLGPGLVLLLGAMVLVLPRSKLPRRMPFIVALASVVSASGLLAWLLLSDWPVSSAWAWDPVTLPGGQWLLQVTGWNGLALSLLLLLGCCAVLLSWDSAATSTRNPLAALLAVLAAASFFVLSGNVLTLAGAWIILDVALNLYSTAEGGGVRARSWAVQGWGVLLVLAAVLFAGPVSAQGELTEDASSLAVLALVLAALLRCGAYPVHLWLLPERDCSRRGQLVQFVLSPLSGVWLLGWVHSIIGPYWRFEEAWAALGVLGMLAGGLAAWLTHRPVRRAAWAVISRMGMMVTVAALGAARGPVAAVWIMLTLALGAGGLVVGQAIARQWGWRQPMALSTLALVGFPGTVGFPAVATLWPLVMSPLPMLPFLALALAAETLLVGGLLSDLRRSDPEDARPVALWAAIRLIAAAVLLAVPLLVWGIWPSLLARMAALPPAEAMLQPLPAQISRLPIGAWVALSLPWVLGALLAWQRARLVAEQIVGSEAIGRVVRLDWGRAALQWAGGHIAGFLRWVTAVVEGEGYLGWLGLASLLAWLLWRL